MPDDGLLATRQIRCKYDLAGASRPIARSLDERRDIVDVRKRIAFDA